MDTSGSKSVRKDDRETARNLCAFDVTGEVG